MSSCSNRQSHPGSRFEWYILPAMPTPSRGREAFAAVLSLVVSVCSSCNRTSPPPEPTPTARVSRLLRRETRDVVLVTVDTLRYDATGFSGAGKAETPIMDSVAAGGVVFTWTHAHAVVTTPSHASILTGLYPYQHGIRDNGGFVLAQGVPTLASFLKARGYATAAFVSAFTVDHRFGLGAGFDLYDDEVEKSGHEVFTVPERRGEETVSLAKSWWEAHRGTRRFLWIHLFAPHFPYEPPEPFASRYRSAPYYGEVAWADSQLEPLLKPLVEGRDAPGIVILTSDHGESLGEHGESAHGLFAYESTLRVPLVVWAPGMLSAGADDRPARHVDILPTVLDLLGQEIPRGLPGRSLFGTAPQELDEGSYFEALSGYLSRGSAPLFGRLEGRRKAVRLPIPELYALDKDPGETTNLAEQQRGVLRDLLSRLPAEVGTPIRREALDEEAVRKLRSLGYVVADKAGTPPSEFDESSDPKNMIQAQRALDEAGMKYRSGEMEAAIHILQDLLARYPKMLAIYFKLGLLYSETGKSDEAVRVLSNAVSLGLADEPLCRLLAFSLTRSRRPQRAREVLAPYQESEDADTQCALARIAVALGQEEEARARCQRALRLDPKSPDALLELGMIDVRRGRFDEAKRSLELAVKGNPHVAIGWNVLGVVWMQLGDASRAMAAWERASQEDPRFPDPLFNLALARSQVGDSAGAIRNLETYMPLVEGERRRRAEKLVEALRRRVATGGRPTSP